MNEQYTHPTDDSDYAPSPEQFEEISQTIEAYIDTGKVRGTDYVDDKPEGDLPAKRYIIPVEDQAAQVFRIPAEIRGHKPGNFRIVYITPHRFEETEEPHVALHFTYDYDHGKSATYMMHGVMNRDGTREWSGEYIQESDSASFDVEDIIRPLTHQDLNMLNVVAASAVRLK